MLYRKVSKDNTHNVVLRILIMATNDVMSNILDRILDSMGLDEDTRQRKMRCQKVKELLDTWEFESILYLPGYPLNAGSSYETTTVDGLSSDIDVLVVRTDHRVIHDIEQWIPGDDRPTYMIDETDCYKSYVKLCALSPHYPGPLYKEMVSEIPTHCVTDENGKIFMSSVMLVERLVTDRSEESHGPALQVTLSNNMMSDGVISLPCDFFPNSALRWKERQTPDTRQRVGESFITEANHCHVVPVGNKSSPNRSLEWRYSFTHIERKLVHLWNNTQYKLYVIMKFILKDLIEPYVSDVLSSYHLKTIMFWMNEEYPRDFFKNSNFIHCLLRYLTNLADTVRCQSLPQYFVEACNLYNNKMDDRTSQQLPSIIQQIINTFPCSLFDIKRRSLGYMLHHVLTDSIPLQTVCDFYETERCAGMSFDLNYDLQLTYVRLECTNVSVRNATTINIQSALQQLRSKADVQDIEIKDFIYFFQKNLVCDLSIDFLSKIRLFPNIVDTKSIVSSVTNVQRYVNSCCINTRLKVAAFLVFTGDFQEGSVLLDSIERQIKPYTYHMCSHSSCREKKIMVHEKTVLDNKPALCEYAKHFMAGVVEYRSDVIGHIPRALVYEIFRSTTLLPTVKRNDDDDFEWHRHAVIHCPMFMYFLRYVIAKAKSLYAESKANIDNMKRTSKQLTKQSHAETNHNVIGHCHMELGDTQRAYKEYKKSLKVQKFDNAAIWHIAVLLRRQIRGEQ